MRHGMDHEDLRTVELDWSGELGVSLEDAAAALSHPELTALACKGIRARSGPDGRALCQLHLAGVERIFVAERTSVDVTADGVAVGAMSVDGSPVAFWAQLLPLADDACHLHLRLTLTVEGPLEEAAARTHLLHRAFGRDMVRLAEFVERTCADAHHHAELLDALV